jgi:hypothetical protein
MRASGGPSTNLVALMLLLDDSLPSTNRNREQLLTKLLLLIRRYQRVERYEPRCYLTVTTIRPLSTTRASMDWTSLDTCSPDSRWRNSCASMGTCAAFLTLPTQDRPLGRVSPMYTSANRRNHRIDCLLSGCPARQVGFLSRCTDPLLCLDARARLPWV